MAVSDQAGVRHALDAEQFQFVGTYAVCLWQSPQRTEAPCAVRKGTTQLQDFNRNSRAQLQNK